MTDKWKNSTPPPQEQRQICESEPGADALLSLDERFAATPVIAELLRQRGITDTEQADAFFAPSLSSLHDPFLMPGMHKAVERLNEAMGAKEKILVYGDYDVDGTTAVSLVYKYLSQFYSAISYYIPGNSDKVGEGK